MDKNNNLNGQNWLEEYGDYLFNYVLLRVKDSYIAEDLVQETLLAAMSAQSTFLYQSSVRTWLTGILKHKLSDYFRAQGREIAIGDLVDQEDEDILDSFFNDNGAG
ncbi:sigma factor [Nitrosomonas communis]|uniref:sigma factor n=1 Tax=Nitrosomonas communis TaxID=44574 RepID=UPI003D2C7D7B